MKKKLDTRRTDTEKVQIGSLNDGMRRYYDQNFEVTVVKIISGDFYVTDEPNEMIVTILGSCVAACIRDPIAGVGGMNHFLLPGNKHGIAAEDASTRYGSFAMEKLINEILKKGGLRNRLEIKLFGGGNVIESSAKIGDSNAQFVRDYLRDEGLTYVAEDLGGTYPRRVHYFPDTGKVMVRKLYRKEDYAVIEEEKRYEKTLVQKPVEGDIELFG